MKDNLSDGTSKIDVRTVAATIEGKMFKRKYRFKRVKLAWHHQNRFKRKLVLLLRFSLRSNFWKSHVAITHINKHTHSCRHHALRSGQALRMTRQARQGSQITNVEESAGSTSMAKLWCGGPAWHQRDAPHLPHLCDLARERDFRSGDWGAVREA